MRNHPLNEVRVNNHKCMRRKKGGMRVHWESLVAKTEPEEKREFITFEDLAAKFGGKR